jgi:hypothetical protein
MLSHAVPRKSYLKIIYPFPIDQIDPAGTEGSNENLM